MKVFFDVDGVVVQGWHADPARRQRWDQCLHGDLGVDPAALQQRLFHAAEGPAMIALCQSGARDLAEVLAEILPDLGYRGPVSDVMDYWFSRDAKLDAPLLALVARLGEGGCAPYLATGQEHHRARYLWQEVGLDRWFGRMFYSAGIGVPKKDIRFFEAINAALGIAEGEAPLFFDDQPEVVAVARAAGWDAVVYRDSADVAGHPRLARWLEQ